MGGVSDVSKQNLLGAESIAGFLAENQDNMLYMTLSEYLMALLKQRNLRRSDVVRNSDLEKAYVYQIFNGEKNPSRDKLIAITFGLHLPAEETPKDAEAGRIQRTVRKGSAGCCHFVCCQSWKGHLGDGWTTAR